MCTAQTLIDHLTSDPHTLDALIDLWCDCQDDAGYDTEDIVECLVYVQGTYDPHAHPAVWQVFQKHIDKQKQFD